MAYLPGFKFTAVDGAGNTLGSTSVEVRRDLDSALVQLYGNREGTVQIVTNPFNADANGDAEFFAQPGSYTVTLGSGTSPQTFPLILPKVDYDTRAELVTAIAIGLKVDDGTAISADGLTYIAKSGETAISDMPGFLPQMDEAGAASIIHFGADPTGSASSASAINAAIQYVGTNTPRPLGIVYCPKGDYLLDATIIGDNGVKLQGAGKTATRFYRTGSYGHTYHQTAGAPLIDGIWFEHGTKFDSTKGNGTELVTNGDFEDGSTGWTLGTGWSIAAGVASGAAGTASDLINDGATVTAGRIYLITYQILNYSAGVVTAEAGNTSGATNNGDGWYMDFVVAADTSAAAIRKNASFVGDIDNFSCVLAGDPLDYRQDPTDPNAAAHVRLENCARGKISNCLFSRMPYQVDFKNSQNIDLENNEYFSTYGPITELQEGIAQVRYGDGTEATSTDKCSLMTKRRDLHTGSTIIMSTTTDGLAVEDGSGNVGAVLTNDELNIGPQHNLQFYTCEMFEDVAGYYDRASVSQVNFKAPAGGTVSYGHVFNGTRFDNGAGDLSSSKQVHFEGNVSRSAYFNQCQFFGGQKCLNGIYVDRDTSQQTHFDLKVVDCLFVGHVGNAMYLDGVTGGVISGNTIAWWNSRELPNVDKNFTAAIHTTANTDKTLITGNIIGGDSNAFANPTYAYQGIYLADTAADVTVRGNKNVGVSNYFTNAGFTVDSLTISGGVVAVDFDDQHGFFVIDTEASAATDDLDTINGGRDGQIIVCRQANAARDVTFKDGTGNLQLAGDYAMTAHRDTITLMWDEAISLWLELSRSDNN